MKPFARLMVLISAALAFAPGATAGVTSRSYVQKGLVAQYDGINNAGHDSAHNPDAAKWTNLAGDAALDAVKGANVTWVENGWQNAANGKPFSVAKDLAKTTGSGAFTLQFACTPSRDNVRQCFFSQYNYTSAYGAIAIEHNNSSDTTGKVRLYRFQATETGSNFDKLTGATIEKDVFTSASVGISSTEQIIWLNGAEAVKNTASFGAASTSCPSIIGGEPSRDNMAFYGTYNAFRLYNRVLTDNEAKVNAAVDAIRFDNALPAKFTLGGGYSFDNDGDLCVTVSASGEGGAVSVNGGAASAIVKQYGTATLQAAANDGYVFQRWQGDTDAITAGSATSQTITVSPTSPIELVAVFKAETRGLDAYSYVQKGLVACFDGIDNAATGEHVSNAAAWTDLTGNGNDATPGATVSWNGADGWTNSSDGTPMLIPEADGSATTLAGVTATKVFTVNFAVKPSRHTSRQAFFGQWDKKGFCIEHNASGSVAKTGFVRGFYNYLSGTRDDQFKDVNVESGEWATIAFSSDTSKRTVWKNGTASQTITANLTGTITNICPSVIGGDNTRADMAFRGTYNAFRIYNRVLTEDEIKINAAIDDKRFNGGKGGIALPEGWSFADDDTLMVAISATATAGGKISYRGGAAQGAVSEYVNHDGSRIVTLEALPDAGCVFDCWSGDADAIASGSILTPCVTVDSTRPCALTACFRPNGDAADGVVSSVSFTGDAAADGVVFSTTLAGEKQGYIATDIALPVLPAVTNRNVSCIYFPSPSDAGAGTTYRQDARLAGRAVPGSVATLFVRFRWDGPVPGAAENFPTIVMNGYTSWNNSHDGYVDGFAVRLAAAANETKGYPTILVPGKAVGGNNAGITTTGAAYVDAGKWVDMFVSVYPSPTDGALSNADIWYCETPAWNDAGYFAAPKINHRHFGDKCAIPYVDTKTAQLRFGCEPNPPANGGADSGDNAKKAFRGAIAEAKGWNRLLSGNEMWTVMAGFDGVQTFDNANLHSRPVAKVENLDGSPSLGSKEGQNTTPVSFLGDAEAAHYQRSLTTTYNSATLLFNAPKDGTIYPYRYKTKIENAKSGATHPVHLDFNGKTVWTSSGVDKGDEITIELSGEDALPGLNELTWHYDTDSAGNWLTFGFHSLKIMAQPSGLMLIVR